MGPDFSTKTSEALARRAALRCSNPDCDKLTSGPNSDDQKATNIGEAAHVYGAREGSARYRAEMVDEERSAISNAIWLCRDCHGLIDKDAPRYSPELLVLWKESHERKILGELGKAGERLRALVADRELLPFAHLPYYIQQIVRDRPTAWEYLLTAELLDHYLAPVLRKSRDLQKGLISKPRLLLPKNEFLRWIAAKSGELSQTSSALAKIVDEFSHAWGLPGQPGDPLEIDHVCRLFGNVADRATTIAEETSFVNAPEGFERVAELTASAALHLLKDLPTISQFIRSILDKAETGGHFVFNLELRLPEGWSEEILEAVELGRAAVEARGEW